MSEVQASYGAAPQDTHDDITALFDDLLEVLFNNLSRRMRYEGTSEANILALWQPYEVGMRSRLSLLVGRAARGTKLKN